MNVLSASGIVLAFLLIGVPFFLQSGPSPAVGGVASVSSDRLEAFGGAVGASFDNAGLIAGLAPGRYVLSSGTYRVGADATVPNGVVLAVAPGSSLSVDEGKTLSFSGSVDPQVLTRIFIGGGTVGGLRFSRPEWFGADPSGVEPSDAAWNSAVKALAPNGGEVEAACGANYKVADTVQIGNGTPSAVTTRQGVKVRARCAIPGFSTASAYQWPAGSMRGTQFSWSGPAGGIMFKVAGSDGWSIDDVTFDCGSRSAAGIGLQVVSAENGDSSNIATKGCTSIGLQSTTVPNILRQGPGGGLFHMDSLRNRYRSIFADVPPGAIGLSLDGEDTQNNGLSSDTDYNTFEDIQCTGQASGPSTCLSLRNSDANQIHGLFVTFPNILSCAITFDASSNVYNGLFPNSNSINHVDWGTLRRPVCVKGKMTAQNHITGILGVNGGSADPFLDSKVIESDDTLSQQNGRIYAYGLVQAPVGRFDSIDGGAAPPHCAASNGARLAQTIGNNDFSGTVETSGMTLMTCLLTQAYISLNCIVSSQDGAPPRWSVVAGAAGSTKLVMNIPAAQHATWICAGH